MPRCWKQLLEIHSQQQLLVISPTDDTKNSSKLGDLFELNFAVTRERVTKDLELSLKGSSYCLSDLSGILTVL